MQNLKSYDQFILEEIHAPLSTSLNEGIFDSLKSIYTRLQGIFRDTTTLNKQVDTLQAKTGEKDAKVAPKGIRAGSTLIVKLADPKNAESKSLLSMTKLADLPDGSGLFQISGSDSPPFLKALGVKDTATLELVGVMAIIAADGFIKGKPLSMRVYKGVTKDGKPTVTQTVIQAALNADDVLKEKVQ